MTRIFSQQPFTAESPWNRPIGGDAVYGAQALKAVTGVRLNGAGGAGTNKFATSIEVAASTDDYCEIRFTPSTGTKSARARIVAGLLNYNNTAANETLLATGDTGPYPIIDYPIQAYSTANFDDSANFLVPAGVRTIQTDYRSHFRLPEATSGPSPDSDGFFAVFQPDGTVMESYASILLADRSQLYCNYAGYTDAFGDGVALTSCGRRASLLPCYAGLIRDGELAGGINHALAMYLTADLLSAPAVWPAATIDSNAGYSGAISMGSLFALPRRIRLDHLVTTPQGLAVATAARDFGVYVVERLGGTNAACIVADINSGEIGTAFWDHTQQFQDLQRIIRALHLVTNNSEDDETGGGGTPIRPTVGDLEDL